MSDARSPEDRVIASPLVVVLAGVACPVRILNRRESRAWREVLTAKTGALFGAMDDMQQVIATGAVFDLATDSILELVMAYDVEHVLGRDVKDFDDATDFEIYGALKAIIAVAFPLVQDVGGLLALGVGAVRSANPSSTNGPSRNGASTRKASTRA
jgi:hypothetical protein